MSETETYLLSGLVRGAAASVQVCGTAHEVHAHLVVAGVDGIILRDQDGEAERTGVLLGDSDLSVLATALDGVGLCGSQRALKHLHC